MHNPHDRAALQHAVELSTNVELQVAGMLPGGAPLLALLQRARERAALAMVALGSVDATDAAAIRKLQNEMELFKRVIEDLREIASEGKDAVQQLSEEERGDIVDALGLDDEAFEDLHNFITDPSR